MASNYFTQLYGGDRDRGYESVSQRVGMMMLFVDLSSLTEALFVTLCQLFNGINIGPVGNSKDELLNTVRFALAEQEDDRTDIANRRFADDTPENRAAFMRKLDRERKHLRELDSVIDKLDDDACFTLLMRVKEVYAGRGDNLHGRCITVYEKMQGRRQL